MKSKCLSLLRWQVVFSVCASSQLRSEMLFTDVTTAANILHNHSHPSTEDYWQEDFSWMTGGAVAEDFNNDGWIDLFCLQGGSSPDLLYINQGDGTFIDEATIRGVNLTGPHIGTCAADYDNDGDIDLFISGSTGSHVLFLNNGSGHFSPSSTLFSGPTSGATSPSWGDLNNDGLLDLSLGAWRRNGLGDVKIFLQQPGGHLSLIQSLPSDWSFTPVFANLDQDRFSDLLIVSDFSRSSLLTNNTEGLVLPFQTIEIQNGMGTANGDFDSDGDLDLFLTAITGTDVLGVNWSIANGNRLFINDGNANFTDQTETSGVRDGAWGWGAVAEDFDKDGDLDLYQVNGWPADSPDSVTLFDQTPARLFENLGGLVFSEISNSAGEAGNTGQGRCVVSFDYDNDGDQDLFICNNSELVIEGEESSLAPGPPVLLRNDSVNNNHWLKVHLAGTSPPHHSHGIGSRVYLTTGGLTQMRELNASSGYLGHGPNRIADFGLGATTTCDVVRAVWTNGDETEWQNIAPNQSITLTSPKATISSRVVNPGDLLSAHLNSSEIPTGAVASWTIDGAPLSSPESFSLQTEGEHLIRVTVSDDQVPATFLWSESLLVTVELPGLSNRSVARQWNEEILSAIRLDFPDPTVHARNLYHLSVAMWDAWATFDTTAVGVIHREQFVSSNIESDRREAMSYAAYRILIERYQSSSNASTSLTSFKNLMNELGYNPAFVSPEESSPAALGNRIANSVLTFFSNDNAHDFSSFLGTHYQPVNPPLPVNESGTTMTEPNRWQPLQFEIATTQNGQTASLTQSILGPHWGAVRPFSLPSLQEEALHFDPGPPPLLNEATDSEFKNGNVTALSLSQLLDVSTGNPIDISPASRGNNSLGQNNGDGYSFNPITGLPYSPNIVNHADYGRVIAEFWADGPESETPPGHWNILANEVADTAGFTKKIGGTGPEIGPLEWDVKTYLALNGALHDAAIAAWGCKRVYDYVRPISSIRYMGGLGQSSDPASPSYSPDGLPLIPGLIELITPNSSLPTERHAHLNTHLNEVAVRTWTQETEPPSVDWILAEDWLPYQRDTFVSPAFPGYVSGHSTFSRAGAEILTRITGNPYFPGGMGTFTAEANDFLEFDSGPSEDVTLQWATYFDAADEAGISRLYGGIHVPADDGPGRIIGSECGLSAWNLAQKYFDGSIQNQAIDLSFSSPSSSLQLEWKTIRGHRYQLQGTPSLPFPDILDPKLWFLAEETEYSLLVDPANNLNRFFRIIRETTTSANQ